MMTYCIIRPTQKPRRFYEETAREYVKRLSRFCKVRYLNDIDKKNERDFVIQMSPDGTQLSSEEMASRLQRLESAGSYNRIIFSVKEETHFDQKWALTSINLPLDLQTVLLLEQIYRAQKIMHNETYHK